VDEDALRVLDDVLRGDVPGTDGWRWTAEDFHDETYGANLDPALYVVAHDDVADAEVGIVRVWVRERQQPRLGFVGVSRSHRRRSIARALLHQVIAVLEGRGVETVTTEVDARNEASTNLISSLGATPASSYIELALARRD
jgi:ribosomal protein S18 acetylase RimI-like enzyme